MQNVLVVEGWIHEYAIRAAVKEFQSNPISGFLRPVGQSREPEVISMITTPRPV